MARPWHGRRDARAGAGIALDTAGDLIDLLSDLRIAGTGISRWALLSAPRTFELADDLTARLAPLRRG